MGSQHICTRGCRLIHNSTAYVPAYLRACSVVISATAQCVCSVMLHIYKRRSGNRLNQFPCHLKVVRGEGSGATVVHCHLLAWVLFKRKLINILQEELRQ